MRQVSCSALLKVGYSHEIKPTQCAIYLHHLVSTRLSGTHNPLCRRSMPESVRPDYEVRDHVLPIQESRKLERSGNPGSGPRRSRVLGNRLAID
jgi:hypothetical protein